MTIQNEINRAHQKVASLLKETGDLKDPNCTTLLDTRTLAADILQQMDDLEMAASKLENAMDRAQEFFIELQCSEYGR